MAIPELIAALDSHTSQFGPYDLHTVTVVNELAVALWHAGDSDQAVQLLAQALDGLGPRGEDGTVRLNLLCTLGEIIMEQCRMEQARSVYREMLDLCIRRMRYDLSGDSAAAQEIVKNELARLLTEPDNRLEPGQHAIRDMLAKRLNWDAATVC